jgi:hypothetical protein
MDKVAALLAPADTGSGVLLVDATRPMFVLLLSM